jgi:hypothetical protein
MTMKEHAAVRHAEVAAMSAGDYVYNVPSRKSGIILEDVGSSGYDHPAGPAERVFMVAWDDGTVHVAGDTFLQSWWKNSS